MDADEQAERLARLRNAVAERGLAAYLVPRADEFQNEYVAPADDRLGWISGFTGTAGLAVIAAHRAALFVDGRYTLQAHKQALPDFWEHCHLVRDPLESWANSHLASGDRVGFDPRLQTPEETQRLSAALGKHGVALTPVEPNLVDLVWTDRPAPPRGAVEAYPLGFAGESSAAKRERIAAILREARADALVVSAPDNLAWLFNIRGTDLEMTPFVMGYAILRSDVTANLFVDPAKLGSAVRGAIEAEGGHAVTLRDPATFASALADLRGLTVRLDRRTANVFIADTLKAAGASVDLADDPCTAAKAVKNPVQLDGMRRAHRRDGVALVRFLRWFDEVAPGAETEWTLALKLAEFRSRGERYRSLSFPTISAAAGSAAQAHYRTDPESARALQPDEIYLVDSGGQYLDGTTDVTRVLIVGTPTAEMKARYTQVLKGHIAVSRLRFPAGTTGAQIDSFARQFLWEDGVDFDHGTGHGVGCYLSVHEGPHGISKRATQVALEPGMVVSVEPGYYKPNAFGIRIENLAVVHEIEPQPEGAELRVLGFETLTLAPYHRRLIEIAILTDGERKWIDDYHSRVRMSLTPELSTEDAAFLARETAPLQG